MPGNNHTKRHNSADTFRMTRGLSVSIVPSGRPVSKAALSQSPNDSQDMGLGHRDFGNYSQRCSCSFWFLRKANILSWRWENNELVSLLPLIADSRLEISSPNLCIPNRCSANRVVATGWPHSWRSRAALALPPCSGVRVGRDRGQGIEGSTSLDRQRMGVGSRGMRERVRRLSGQFKVRSGKKERQ